MGYQVKWVEENLGITRKMIRDYEDKNLIPKNKNREYRDFEEEDLQRLWIIRLLRGMKFTFAEIQEYISDETKDLIDYLPLKIEKLEKEKADINRYINCAKTIIHYGFYPLMPKNMGTVKFNDFFDNVLAKWNVPPLPDKKEITISSFLDSFTEEELEIYLDKIKKWDPTTKEGIAFFSSEVFLQNIAKRCYLGTNNEEVQLLVKMLYETEREKVNDGTIDMSIETFVKYYPLLFTIGDSAKNKQEIYGTEGCQFIADAIAVFGGYSCFSDVDTFSEKEDGDIAKPEK